MKRIVTPLALAAIILGLAASAEAQYISTLGKAGDATPPDFSFAGPPTGACVWLGMPFATDAQSYALNSIQVDLKNISGTANIGAYLFAADGSYMPVGTVNPGGFVPDTSPGGAFSTITFTPTSPITLSASSKYVFVLSVINGPATGDYQWNWTSSGNGFTNPSGGSWSMPAQVNSGSFSGPPPSDVSTITWTTSTNDRLIGAVNATAVPEPGNYLPIAAVMALGLAGWRRFRRA
jgi:hypothetical protein